MALVVFQSSATGTCGVCKGVSRLEVVEVLEHNFQLLLVEDKTNCSGRW